MSVSHCRVSNLSLAGQQNLQVERVKRLLSTQHQARIEIDSLINGEDFSETLTRARFEEVRTRTSQCFGLHYLGRLEEFSVGKTRVFQITVETAWY